MFEKFGKFVSEHWKTYWIALAGLTGVGLLVALLGGSWGGPIIAFPVFFLAVGYFFKNKYEKG